MFEMKAIAYSNHLRISSQRKGCDIGHDQRGDDEIQVMAFPSEVAYDP